MDLGVGLSVAEVGSAVVLDVGAASASRLGDGELEEPEFSIGLPSDVPV